MTRPIADLLDGLTLFNGFGYPELQAVARYLTRLQVPIGQPVFSEGDPGDSLLILVDGRVAIIKHSDQGPQTLCHEGPGRTIGEMALLDRERRSASCLAEANCELLAMDQAALEQMAKDYPLLAYRFMFCLAQQLSRRLRRTSGELADR